MADEPIVVSGDGGPERNVADLSNPSNPSDRFRNPGEDIDARRDEFGIPKNPRRHNDPNRGKKSKRIPLAEDREPWEMQPLESPSLFAMFCVFRDMGPERTLKRWTEWRMAREEYDEVSRGLPPWDDHRKSRYLYAKASASSGRACAYRWVERAAAYDAHMDRVKVEAHAQAHAEAVRRSVANHTALAQKLQLLGDTNLKHLLSGTDIAKKKVEDLSAYEVLAIIKTGIDVERRVLGLDIPTPFGPAVAQDTVPIPQTEALPSFEQSKAVAKKAVAEMVEAERKKAAQPLATQPPPTGIGTSPAVTPEHGV